MNLSDAGVAVSVSIRDGSPRATEVREAGIRIVTNPSQAASDAQNAVLLIPDSEQPRFYKEQLHENLPEGAALVFAHGFAVHYGRIKPRPDIDVILVAPLSHGDALRESFVKGSGVPCVLAVAQDATGRAWERAESYARAIADDGPFIRSTFAEEVETDLFAEQAVLCGGMPELVRAAFDTLVEHGYNADIAYFSCLRELRAIVGLLHEDSIAGMRSRISDTAQYGSITRGARIIDESVRTELKDVLGEIRSGEFAEELSEDEQKGFPKLREAMEEESRHAIEGMHKKFRG
jgi:ketol-acid reductoisomerase